MLPKAASNFCTVSASSSAIVSTSGRYVIGAFIGSTHIKSIYLEQFIERDRQLAHALAGGVEERIGNRGGGTHNPDLSYAFDAERIHFCVLLGDEDDVDIRNVGVHRYVVLGQAMVHPAA